MDCRFFVPSSLLASQTVKATSKVRKCTVKPEPLTYSQLLNDQARLVTLGQLNAHTASNRSTALRQFLRANHVQVEDVVGNEMRPHFPLSVQNLVTILRGENRSDRSITNTRSALTHWKTSVIEYDTTLARFLDQPTPLAETLKAALGGHPVKRVARQCCVPYGLIYGWLKGKIPHSSNARYLRRIETFFGLELDSLVALAGIVNGARPEQRVGTSVAIQYRQSLGVRTRDEYCLKPPIDSPLRAQWEDFLRYKTALAPALRRSNKGRWSFSQLQVITETEAKWPWFLDGREVPSAQANWRWVTSFLGWMAVPKDMGGLGMPPESLQTLAWLAVPDYVEAYVLWFKRRCGNKITNSTTSMFGLISSMVRPLEGYLYQKPQLQKTLPEAFQNEEWTAVCLRQFEHLRKLLNSLQPEIVPSRDAFEPIQSVIDLPQPLEAIADMVQRMRRDRPCTTKEFEAIWARDIFLVKLLVSNPLRKRNFAALTWSRANINGKHPDNEGSLYQRSDGSWWLFVPKALLKNRRSPVIRDYNSPVHNSVWGDLERYLLRHRNDLLRWPTDLVFLTRTIDPERTCKVKGGDYKKPPPKCHRPWMELSRHISTLTRKYLWKSNGVGSQAFRHLVATSILKTAGGDIKTAALVLNDAELTVAKAYSGMRSGDGAIRMGDLLGATLNRM